RDADDGRAQDDENVNMSLTPILICANMV
ncbi:MAG: hypothetical protein ACD_76C00027G0001, partial [uncultured bacterium]